MSGRHKFSPPATGGISLLVVFTVLCLTVFALLSLTTAQADRRLADASTQATADYYRADYEAQTILARLRNGELPAGVTKENNTYTYACAISPVQELKVSVHIQGTEYTILCWQAVSTAEWDNDETIEVWDGSAF